ncbi:MAG: type II toxin-antitoxin system death-on-curing family toxin [Bdellovibrionales bacterium]
MRYLTLEHLLDLHRLVIAKSGGAKELRDINALESAIAQPQMTFEGVDLYPSLAAKAASLAHSLIQNHPFVDGNKRVGHAAMEVFLILNGYEISATIEEQESYFLSIASGQVTRSELTEWIETHLVKTTAN